MKDKKQPEASNIPISLYPSYFAFLDEPDTTPEDIEAFTRALYEYAKGNFDFVSENRFIRSELRQIRVELKLRRESYLKKCETLKANGSKGGKAKAEKGKKQSTENQGENVANAKENVANAKENVANAKKSLANAKKSLANSSKCDIDIDIETSTPGGVDLSTISISKNTPQPPGALAGLASGGDGFKFLYFLGQYERLTADASKWELPSGCDELQRDRAAWVCTDQAKQPEVFTAIQAKDKEALLRATKGPTARTVSRELWKLCQAVASVTAQQLANVGGCKDLEGFRQAVAHEVNICRMGTEGTAVFKTMLGKIDYIKQGNKITSLSAFLAARGK